MPSWHVVASGEGGLRSSEILRILACLHQGRHLSCTEDASAALTDKPGFTELGSFA